MKQLAKQSALNPDEVLVAAATYFGPDGLGLKITDRADGCITFEGGGGFVWVRACPNPSGSTVDVDTREWDQPATHFLKEI
jgi:hypothetical protein